MPRVRSPFLHSTFARALTPVNSARTAAAKPHGKFLALLAVLVLMPAFAFADTIQFASSSIPVAESVGTVSLTLTRTGTGVGSHSVSFAANDGTAFGGSDYVDDSGTVTWANGDLSDKTITFNINNDTRDEPDESFSVVLSIPLRRAFRTRPLWGLLRLPRSPSPMTIFPSSRSTTSA